MMPRRLRAKRHSPYLLRVLELRRDTAAMKQSIGNALADAAIRTFRTNGAEK